MLSNANSDSGLRAIILVYIFFCLFLMPAFGVEADIAKENKLPRTGQRTCYNESGIIIDHDNTGQDGDLQAGRVWPEPRFTRNGDGTVSDHLTGLMWLMDGSCLGSLSWQAAREYADAVDGDPVKDVCRDLSVNYDDWRLPEIRELETLTNSEAADNAKWLSSRGFTAISNGSYWSATVGPNPYRAWILEMQTAKVVRSPKVNKHNVLLVRGQKEVPTLTAGDAESREPVPRFQDSGNGTIVDTVSGLMWLKDGDCLGRVDWQTGLAGVQTFNRDSRQYDCTGYHGSYQDWALPNRHELRSLVDHGYDMPALPVDHPFRDIKPRYWTSTSFAGSPEQAYVMHTGWGDLLPVDKADKNNVILVRPVGGRTERARVPDKTQTPEIGPEDYLLRPLGDFIPVDWPATRFTRHGDGTIIDNVTGLMWLRDADCFGRRTMANALRGARLLNENPGRFNCRDYTGEYDDWHIPSLADLSQLAEAAEEEPAAWLNRQGAVKVKARDYWSAEENYYNLYYGWAVNLKDGASRNYPESFRLYVWPVRKTRVVGPVNPKPSIMVNGQRDMVHMEKGGELLLSVAIDQVSATPPAVYSLRYEAPDGKVRWLDNGGRWLDEEARMYNGLLFQLEDYPVFRADTIHSEAGLYTFHFSIEVTLNPDFSPVYSDTVKVMVR